jgi:hypothetical protein
MTARSTRKHTRTPKTATARVRDRGRSSAERRRTRRPKLLWPPTGGVVDRVVKLSNGEYEVHSLGIKCATSPSTRSSGSSAPISRHGGAHFRPGSWKVARDVARPVGVDLGSLATPNRLLKRLMRHDPNWPMARLRVISPRSRLRERFPATDKRGYACGSMRTRVLSLVMRPDLHSARAAGRRRCVEEAEGN